MSTSTATTTAINSDGSTTTQTAKTSIPPSAVPITPIISPVRDFLGASLESVGMADLGNLSKLLKTACEDRPGVGPAYPHARCMVVKNGKLVFDEVASAPGFECPDDDSIYRFASMTKVVTSVAIMQCYEKGLLNITDPVAKFIPSFGASAVFKSATKSPAPEPFASMGISEIPTALQTEPQATPMTIVQLMNHTSGLGYGGLSLTSGQFDDIDLWYFSNGMPVTAVAGSMFGKGDEHASLEGVCNLMAKMPLKFQPGSKWEYGMGHIVCGRIIEVVTGVDFLTYLEENIFKPLGMDTASFGEANCPKLLKPYAYGPNEMTGAAYDLEGPKFGRPFYNTAESGHIVALGTTAPEDMHFNASLRSEYMGAIKTREAPIFGDAGLHGSVLDYYKFACALINRGVGANGARILGARSLELMTKNHLPGGKTIGEMENKSNNLSRRFFADNVPCGAMGYGLGVCVSIGDRHQLEDGVLAMPAGAFCWAGIFGTDVIWDPANDLMVLFFTQMMITGFNVDVNGMCGTGLHARYVYAALK